MSHGLPGPRLHRVQPSSRLRARPLREASRMHLRRRVGGRVLQHTQMPRRMSSHFRVLSRKGLFSQHMYFVPYCYCLVETRTFYAGPWGVHLSHRVSGCQVRRVPALSGLYARHLRRTLDLPLQGGLDWDHMRHSLVVIGR